MKNLSTIAKGYILGTLLIGLGLTAWMAVQLDWMDTGLYLMAALGGVAQTLKLEGPDDRTNYSIAWFVYGFAFIVLDPAPAMFVVVIAHLVEWAWHRYPWYIQSFNIVAHLLPLYLAGQISGMLGRDLSVLDLSLALAAAAAGVVFVVGNHFMVGVVLSLARGMSFAKSGVIEFFALFLDFTVLSMGVTTALLWKISPFASLLNILPLYLLYNALRVPALKRQLQEMKKAILQPGLDIGGD